MRKGPLGEPRERWYWTQEDLDRLVRLAALKRTTRQIAEDLERTPKAIRNMACRLGLALPGYEAQRAAKRRGEHFDPLAPRPTTIKITQDFDISVLTRDERRALAAKLLEDDPVGKPVAPKAFHEAERAAFWAKLEDRNKRLGWNVKPTPRPPGNPDEKSAFDDDYLPKERKRKRR